MYLWILLRRNHLLSDYFKCFDSRGLFVFFLRNCHADIFSLERHAFKTPCQKPSDRMSQTCHILSLKKQQQNTSLLKTFMTVGGFNPELQTNAHKPHENAHEMSK